MIEERYELALDRIRLMQTEDTVRAYAGRTENRTSGWQIPEA